jgi:hypothetical protein
MNLRLTYFKRLGNQQYYLKVDGPDAECFEHLLLASGAGTWKKKAYYSRNHGMRGAWKVRGPWIYDRRDWMVDTTYWCRQEWTQFLDRYREGHRAHQHPSASRTSSHAAPAQRHPSSPTQQSSSFVRVAGPKSVGEAYQILGITRHESKTSARKKYLRLAKAHHPDVTHDNGVRMRILNMAWDIAEKVLS